MNQLYYQLGKERLKSNPEQAWLCFQNALFYAEDPAKRQTLQTELENLSATGVSVPPTSIVICSYNSKEDMIRCIESIRETTSCEMREIIVVDNASTDGITDYLQEQSDLILQLNTQNLGFPAGCNQGIGLATPGNDIFLLNNDTILMENSLFWLRMGLYEDKNVGATGSVSNHVVNGQRIENPERSFPELLQYAKTHNVPMEHPYIQKLRLIGFAMLLKGSVLEQIGSLDENFSPGNYEDDDLSIRIQLAGYRLLLCRNSFIYHFGGKNFRKNNTSYQNLLRKNSTYFVEKWGFSLEHASNVRTSLLSILPKDKASSFRLLFVGCSAGAELLEIMEQYPHAEIFATESLATAQTLAKQFLPSIYLGSLSDVPENLVSIGSFDYAILAEEVPRSSFANMLSRIHQAMKRGGSLLALVPNLFFLPYLLDPASAPESSLNRQTLLSLFERQGFDPTSLDGISDDNSLPENSPDLISSLQKEMPELSEIELKTRYFLLTAAKDNCA